MERVQDPVTKWCVLIEETVGRGESQRWGVSEIRKFDTRDEALAAAEQAVREYQPQHPTFAKGRDAYQVGEDSWIVWVPGATREYHFRVSVGKQV
ncbi:hypothetical protein [Kibdelosporangium aridum]|uniref:hypothetical protein n=1 Tax=Kibdelosporangium aridum TaxID=2030 RepID=UPI0005250C5A